MERDVQPREFEDIEDLIDNYVFGSAIVVGYFLAYVYGSSKENNFNETLKLFVNFIGDTLLKTNFNNFDYNFSLNLTKTILRITKND